MPKIHVDVKGQGLSCFVLHGGPGLDSSYFHPYLDALQSSLQLFFIDLRGCGKSPRVKVHEYTFSGMLDDLEKLRQFSKCGQIVIFGHSFGGFLALEYALRFPQHVSGLILVSTAADTAFIKEFQQHIDEFPGAKEAQRKYFQSTRTDDDFKQYTLESIPLYFQAPEKFPAQEILERIRYNAMCFEEIKRDYLVRYSVVGRLKDIKVPSLVIAGEYDRIVPAKFSQTIAEKIPHARFEVIQNAGHFPFIEGTRQFKEAVLSWIKEKGPK